MYCLAADGRDGVTGRRMTAVAQAARAKLPMSVEPRVLVLNAGSLSVKFALYSTDLLPTLHLSGAVEGIGHSGGRFHTMDWTAHAAAEETRPVSSLEDAIELVLTFMERRATGVIVGVGHRVVHGGPGCDGPKYVTPELEERLEKLIPLAPLHMPNNVAGIAAVRARRPELQQVACFDTAFHETLPELAKLTGLPRDIAGEDIRRYGFQGLSYESVVDEIRRREGTRSDDELLIVAHLGEEASMAAIKDGRSIETTMGFSILAGLPTGTRCGDLDPGIVLYLLMQRGLSGKAVQQMLYERSGLLGLLGRQFGHAGASRAKAPSGDCGGDRLFLLPGARIDRLFGCDTRWARSSGLHGRHRRQSAGDPRAYLRGTSFHRHRPRFGAQSCQRANDFARRERSSDRGFPQR